MSCSLGHPAPWPAPGKLNLFLHVVGRRPDGYHELQTAFQFIDLRDSIRFYQRQPGVMAGIVKTLTDQNIRDLGAYYAALPPPPPFAKADPVDADKTDKTSSRQRFSSST